MNIPFTHEQFFRVIELYNASVFPAQLIILLLALAALYLLHSKVTRKSRLIMGFLGILWAWTGIFYHLVHFTGINKAAWGFGILFVLQGLFFLFESLVKNRVAFDFTKDRGHYTGYFFVLFGIIIYPVIGYLLGISAQSTISLGLPCPTTIMTFGFLMLTSRKVPLYLLIIPTIWAVIGTGAAVKFGVYQDYVMLLSAVIADIYLVTRKKQG